jgi:hypothetical protein
MVKAILQERSSFIACMIKATQILYIPVPVTHNGGSFED